MAPILRWQAGENTHSEVFLDERRCRRARLAVARRLAHGHVPVLAVRVLTRAEAGEELVRVEIVRLEGVWMSAFGVSQELTLVAECVAAVLQRRRP